jgi:hypothetical protein
LHPAQDRRGDRCRGRHRFLPPFTIRAFFYERKLTGVPSPTLDQGFTAYEATKEAGLKHVRLGNLGVFVKGEGDIKRFMTIAPEAIWTIHQQRGDFL